MRRTTRAPRALIPATTTKQPDRPGDEPCLDGRVEEDAAGRNCMGARRSATKENAALSLALLLIRYHTSPSLESVLLYSMK